MAFGDSLCGIVRVPACNGSWTGLGMVDLIFQVIIFFFFVTYSSDAEARASGAAMIASGTIVSMAVNISMVASLLSMQLALVEQ